MLRKRLGLELKIEWNNAIFEGMTRSQIVQFKEENRALLVRYYKSCVKCKRLEEKLINKRNAFLKGEKSNGNAIKLNLMVGGLALATVCTIGASRVNAIEAPVVEEVVQTIELQEISLAPALENAIANINTEIVEAVNVEAEVYAEVEAEVEMDVVETQEIYVADVEVSTEVDTEIESVCIETEAEEVYNFDKALEIISERCEANYNGVAFSGLTSTIYAPLYGTYVKDNFSVDEQGRIDSTEMKVSGWFEAYFGTEARNYELRIDNSFQIKAGGAKFESLEEGFVVTIDREAIEVISEIDADDALEASIRGGVSQEMRNYLESEECQQFLPVMGKLMWALEENARLTALESQSLDVNVKGFVQKELKALTGYDVIVKIK